MKTTIYWSRAALGLAERQTRDMSESKANEILRHRGSYRNPSGEDFFPFPAPEPSTDFLEKFPDLANMPRDSNAKLKLLLSRAKEYEIILIKLANAGEISFYDPATLLRISDASEVTDPIVDMDKIASQIIQYSETNCTFSAVRPLSTLQALPASGPVTPAAVPILPPAAALPVTRHKLRTNSLDAPIKKAVKAANSLNTGAVYLELRTLALNCESPFTGAFDGDALLYTKDDNKTVAKLSKGNLGKRLKSHTL